MQSFTVLASLVSDLAGGQNDPLVRPLRVNINCQHVKFSLSKKKNISLQVRCKLYLCHLHNIFYLFSNKLSLNPFLPGLLSTLWTLGGERILPPRNSRVFHSRSINFSM